MPARVARSRDRYELSAGSASSGAMSFHQFLRVRAISGNVSVALAYSLPSTGTAAQSCSYDDASSLIFASLRTDVQS